MTIRAARNRGGRYGYPQTTVRCTEPRWLPRLTSEDYRWLTDTEPTVKAQPATPPGRTPPAVIIRGTHTRAAPRIDSMG